jgi:thiol-disulfide isomerase/thioredoxin
MITKKIFLSLALTGWMACPGWAQGIRFFEGTWEAALAEAKRLDRIIFVDAYAVWCGPCKKMAAEVFTDEGVGNFYNRNFLNVKLDAEKGEGLAFREKYPIAAFPTLFYIDYTGEVVQQVKGAQSIEAFLELGKKALSQIDRSQQFEAAYAGGERNPEFIFNYVRALNKSGKPSTKIANDYLRTQQELTTPFNLRFILEAAVSADSRIFDLLIEHRKAIASLESAELVKQKIEEACVATAQKAAAFSAKSLLDEAVAKMKKHCPDRAAAFELNAEMEYWAATGDISKFLDACNRYAKKQVSTDEKALLALSRSVAMQFGQDTRAMASAEAFAQQATGRSKDYKTFLHYASMLKKNDKYEEAGKVADKALELAKPEGNAAVRAVEIFILELKKI